jgi:hypothetical protein
MAIINHGSLQGHGRGISSKDPVQLSVSWRICAHQLPEIVKEANFTEVCHIFLI